MTLDRQVHLWCVYGFQWRRRDPELQMPESLENFNYMPYILPFSPEFFNVKYVNKRVDNWIEAWKSRYNEQLLLCYIEERCNHHWTSAKEESTNKKPNQLHRSKYLPSHMCCHLLISRVRCDRGLVLIGGARCAIVISMPSKCFPVPHSDLTKCKKVERYSKRHE